MEFKLVLENTCFTVNQKGAFKLDSKKSVNL